MKHQIGAAVCAAMLLSGCSLLGLDREAPPGGDETARPTGEPLKSTVAEKVLDAHPEDSTVALTVQRHGTDHLVASTKITNTGDEDIELDLAPEFADHGDFIGEPDHPYFGIGLLDPEARTLELPYRYADADVCVCTAEDDPDLGQFAWVLEPGQSRTYAAAMPAPTAEVSHVSLYTAMSGPFIDVPISSGKPDLDALGIEDPDTALDNGAKPNPWDLTARTTSPEEDIVENAAGTNINLNADVLFDVDESSLTGKATDILAETAAEIDGYGATEVDIAGHTDSTGDDAINKPLSDKRAAAVRSALEDLIDTKVAFTATGHGSAEPIDSNDTEEGRQRNRRVTVTIPQDAKPDTAPSPGTGKGSKGKPAAEFSAKTTEGEKATVRLTGLRRLAGDVVMLTYTVTNDDAEEVGDWTPVDTEDPWTYMLTPPSGLSLRDPATKREYGTAGYVPKGDSDALLACACSDVDSYLQPGQSTGEFSNLMIVPENVTTVDVTSDRLPDMEGIAIE